MHRRINGDRLWQRLMEMAVIGAIPGDGCCRLSLTDEDEAGRALLQRWCRERGYDFRCDAIGNMFFRRPGAQPDAPPVLVGSHLDTQPSGGRFDGVLGVLAGLEVMQTLDDANILTRHSIELCVWTNEEGSRFAPAMMGSGVASGLLAFEKACAATDINGTTVADELACHGYDQKPMPSRPVCDSYFELHIEQGPVLENTGKTIGVVRGGQGIQWYRIRIQGEETHAGPVPMAMRRDPVPVLGALIALVNQVGTCDVHARSTIGTINTHPGSINVVSGRIDLTVDLRHPDQDVLESMDRDLMAGIAALAERYPDIPVTTDLFWKSPPVRFDPALADIIANVATQLDLPSMDMVSGAGHDAFNLARIVPAAMIFVPCRGGLSHNPAEYITPEQTAAGAETLFAAVTERAKIMPVSVT